MDGLEGSIRAAAAPQVAAAAEALTLFPSSGLSNRRSQGTRPGWAQSWMGRRHSLRRKTSLVNDPRSHASLNLSGYAGKGIRMNLLSWDSAGSMAWPKRSLATILDDAYSRLKWDLVVFECLVTKSATIG